ncbi:MAG: malto-oligosyltrehalose trehalohydrolase, partial [Pedobacter sp.]
MFTKVNLQQRSIGIHCSLTAETSIRIWAPKANQLAIVVPDRSAVVALTADQTGYWLGSSSLLKHGDKYHLLLDGHQVLPDPTSLSQPDGVHGESQIFDLDKYHWRDQNWVPIPLADYIIYELHSGTFSPEGNFQGIISRLDHLVELGITAVEIMPVAQFPGERNWGYDGVFPFAVQDSYGGPGQFMELVDACHAKGIAVILDVVYNHLGPEGNYFESFGPYFTDKYQTPWGKAINFDDAGCDGVREFFLENALMWFRDFHVDTLRLDAVHAIKDFGAHHILQDLSEAVEELGTVMGKSFQLIVECDLNDPKFLVPKTENGYGMSAQWVDEFHHALRVAAGEGRQGYYADFEGIKSLEKAYRSAYVYDGQYSAHRDKHFGAPADGLRGDQFVVFSQNHDQVGNRMLGERSAQLYSFEMIKLMAAAVMVSPYLPMLFMGEEWAAQNPFLYFVSHTDPKLIKAVREGRKAEFASFHQGDAPDPESEDTFLQSKLDWEKVLGQGGQLMFKFYKKLIVVRKAFGALRNGDRNNLSVEAIAEKNCLILTRWEADTRVH